MPACEAQVLALGLIVIAIKSINMVTWDAIACHTLLIGKIVVMVLSFQTSYILFAIYGVILTAMVLFVHLPPYSGPQKIEMLNVFTFEKQVLGNDQEDWLIELYATWCPPCQQFAPLFAELSVKYSTKSFKFGKLDVGRYPMIGKKLNIDSSAKTVQLPSLILFSKGKETKRLPQMDEGGRVIPCTLHKSTIINYFGLESISEPVQTVPSESLKKKQ
mmetsp:Transcript_38747/g.64417  ORF Transcript_38747/g.64417 Transcript_38747/m.64417 type:complete len:217 (-) Transcript_38747:106-756(-)